MLSGAVQQFADIPTGVSLPLVNRVYAGVWTGPALHGVTVSGTPRLRLTVTPNRSEASLFVYLYAVNSSGTGSLITHKPYTCAEHPRPGADRGDALNPWYGRSLRHRSPRHRRPGPALRQRERRGHRHVSSRRRPSWLRIPTARLTQTRPPAPGRLFPVRPHQPAKITKRSHLNTESVACFGDMNRSIMYRSSPLTLRSGCPRLVVELLTGPRTRPCVVHVRHSPQQRAVRPLTLTAWLCPPLPPPSGPARSVPGGPAPPTTLTRQLSLSVRR